MKRQDIIKLLESELKIACQKKAINFERLTLDEKFNLIESGLYDSLGILNLITSIEESLNIEVDLSDYSPKEFTSYVKLIDILEEHITDRMSETQ